ncbi:bublin coiled-coil protein isoform X2 [Lethenteron reissneri]|uniref:bublin coiled-coil protein isoform X2 n=1 Tax=Lethenteron reissneri TaxID=7753 RepID=UPI002AB7359C|nr:bublin coiled-coil protein isoform X2 [Lethenteron reissneri]
MHHPPLAAGDVHAGRQECPLQGSIGAAGVRQEEYQDLNSALDQISSFLDQLEERNDSLNTRLRELLASNQQERRGASSEAQGTQQQNER